MVEDSRQRQTVPPVVVFGISLIAQQMMGKPRTSLFRNAVSVVLAGVAAWFGVGSVTEFRKNQTIVDPFDVEKVSALVTNGPSAVTRNPMYVALLLILVANSLRRGRPGALVPAGGFALAIDRLQIRREEAALEQAFGEEYDRYRRSTPRWLGFP